MNCCFISVMATAEVIKRLSTRATAAEQMIQLLRRQIDEIKVSQGSAGSADQEIQKLKVENSQLKAQVAEWKSKLIAAESANGIKQVSSSNISGAAVDTPKVEAKKISPEKEVKKEKPKKEKKEDKSQAASSDGGASDVHVGRLDMRVGLIRTAKKHPDADSLYVEEVDVGEVRKLSTKVQKCHN